VEIQGFGVNGHFLFLNEQVSSSDDASDFCSNLDWNTNYPKICSLLYQPLLEDAGIQTAAALLHSISNSYLLPSFH
jgi:hypothetical protein